MYEQFNYIQPRNKQELIRIMHDIPHALAYGGGTDLLVFLRARKIEPRCLVDTKGINEFREIVENEDKISIGCAVTLQQIEKSQIIQDWYPALCYGVGQVGSVQIRNKATLVGNVQTASPAGDGLNALWPFDASVVIISSKGQRRESIASFVVGPKKTNLCEGEIISAIEIPKRKWVYQQYFKVGRRNALAISVVNGVVALDLDGDTISDARISLGSVGPTPIRIYEAEKALISNVLTTKVEEEVEQIVKQTINPISDIRASDKYRSYIAGVMVKRKLRSYKEDE